MENRSGEKPITIRLTGRIDSNNAPAVEQEIRFVRIILKNRDDWAGKTIKELKLPHGALIALIRRGSEIFVPGGSTRLLAGDRLLLCAEPLPDEQPVNMREVLLRRDHPWNGTAVKDLDISRQSYVVLVKRKNAVLVPKTDLILAEGDKVFVYSRKRMVDPEEKQYEI